MAEYYLISQLPSLDGLGENSPLPITEERFLELCGPIVGEKLRSELDNLSLVPPRSQTDTSSSLIEAWNNGERSLRLALAKVRAEKMKKPFDLGGASLPLPLVKVANTAAEMESPLEAEKFLNQHRLTLLESLRPMDPFAQDFVFYYWLKLKLLWRMKQFDQQSGETAYKNIDHSIINTDSLEVMQ